MDLQVAVRRAATIMIVTCSVALAAARADAAAIVEGVVFADLDGDGVFSAGDEPRAGVNVVWEASVWATTDAQGRYSLVAPDAGIVWVRTPEGYAPSPTWGAVTAQPAVQTIDLALRPATATGPVSFVDTSDSHIGVVSGEETGRALQGAVATTPAPHFLVITGDITQGNEAHEFEALAAALEGIDVPFIPVIGNHDAYDGGVNYRKYLGPPTYSFDAGGAHFVVIGHDASAELLTAFLAQDLAPLAEGTPVVGFYHFPPEQPVEDALEQAGVDYLFTGHWHSNRTIDRGGLLEFNTEPFVMGGVDFTPAGYRIATLVDGALVITHHTTVEAPVVRITYPRPGECVPPGPVTIVAAVETGQEAPLVTAVLDGQAPVTLAAAGGWDHTTTLMVGSAPLHTLAVRVGDPAGGQRAELTFCAAAPLTIPATLTDWPQLQGGPGHLGATELTIAPPLRTVWARSVGGHLRGGSPVLAGGRLYVPVIDLADETRGGVGGVVALDAHTGALLWEVRTGASVHNAPAVADGLVVFGASDGVVHAVDAVTGAPRWTVDLGADQVENVSWLYAAPTIADGLVYIGLQRKFVALDLATGVEMWTVDPSPSGVWLGSYSAAGVGGGVAIGAFSRGFDGVVGWDAYDGRELWRVPRPYSAAVNTSPLVDGDMAYFGNAETALFAVDLLSADFRWSTKLNENGFDWGYGLAATPALARGRLFVPTQYDHLFALDADTGDELWKRTAERSVLHPVHYRGAAAAWPASPVVTGDVVWIGAADGYLRALDATSGESLCALDLGAPILSGVVPSDDTLFVATWDGTVQALVAAPGADVRCEDPAAHGGEGCDCVSAGRTAGGAHRHLGAALVVFGLSLALVLRLRGRTRRGRDGGRRDGSAGGRL